MVETKIDDANGCRNVKTLCRHKGLWWIDTTLSHYVYDTPTHWRHIST